jgi:hypothetical protein
MDFQTFHYCTNCASALTFGASTAVYVNSFTLTRTHAYPEQVTVATTYEQAGSPCIPKGV